MQLVFPEAAHVSSAQCAGLVTGNQASNAAACDYRGSVALAFKTRNFPQRRDPSSNWTDQSCQRIKSVCERHHADAFDGELSLADHVHELDACEY